MFFTCAHISKCDRITYTRNFIYTGTCHWLPGSYYAHCDAISPIWAKIEVLAMHIQHIHAYRHSPMTPA